jgi:hypothetical protein
MNLDNAKTAQQNMIALLNSMNGSSLVETSATFLEVEALVEQPTNTRVQINPGPVPLFSGSDYLYYNRTSAPVQLGSNDSIEVTVTADMTDEQMFTAAMAVFPLQDEEWRFVAAQKPVGSERPGLLVISAKSDSLIYHGDYSFKLVL